MKYKLIKKYPGSPKLGYLIEESDKNIYFINDGTELYDLHLYPEFWEKVVEKDYEILSYKDTVNNQLYIKDSQLKDCWCVKNGTAPFWKESDLKNSVIHSIKRLSDGEIFTIGEIINTKVDNKYKQSILEIIIKNNNIIFKTKSGVVILNVAQKVKQPLFTTEDGVDVFEGDNIYWINAFTLDGVYCDTYNADCGEFDLKDGLISIEQFNKLNKNNCELAIFGFSTKEKAEEYIIMNKPCLSLNDIKNYKSVIIYSVVADNLQDLVKSKI